LTFGWPAAIGGKVRYSTTELTNETPGRLRSTRGGNLAAVELANVEITTCGG
jgi:hypothetical protein